MSRLTPLGQLVLNQYLDQSFTGSHRQAYHHPAGSDSQTETLFFFLRYFVFTITKTQCGSVPITSFCRHVDICTCGMKRLPIRTFNIS